MRALVADDESGIRRLLRRRLEQLGWTVGDFETGEALVEASRRRTPDLIISDVNMPGPLNGLQACLILRLENPETRIVLMTGDPGNLPEISAAGFPTVLRKPFRLEDIEKVV